MKRRWFQFTAFACGVLFALGLGISGMGRPGKVLAFLDVAGRWDPTLAFVMASAVGLHAVSVRRARRSSAPLLDARFVMPGRLDIDKPLLVGAAIFGVGWGMQGYCPGPALVSLPSLSLTPIVFVIAMVAGQRIAPRPKGREPTTTPPHTTPDELVPSRRSTLALANQRRDQA